MFVLGGVAIGDITISDYWHGQCQCHLGGGATPGCTWSPELEITWSAGWTIVPWAGRRPLRCKRPGGWRVGRRGRVVTGSQSRRVLAVAWERSGFEQRGCHCPSVRKLNSYGPGSWGGRGQGAALVSGEGPLHSNMAPMAASRCKVASPCPTPGFSFSTRILEPTHPNHRARSQHILKKVLATCHFRALPPRRAVFPRQAAVLSSLSWPPFHWAAERACAN